MKFRIGILSVFLLISVLSDHSFFSLAALLAVILHELGHIFAARLCHIRLKECRVGLFGAGLFPKDGLFSYRQEILLCVAGPAANILTALPFFVLCFLNDNLSSDFLKYFVFSSLSLGLLNLLPIHDFDGGRILRAILCLHMEERFAGYFLRAVSFLFVLVLWMFSVYLLLRQGRSLSLFIFSISLFGRIFVSEP